MEIQYRYCEYCGRKIKADEACYTEDGYACEVCYRMEAREWKKENRRGKYGEDGED